MRRYRWHIVVYVVVVVAAWAATHALDGGSSDGRRPPFADSPTSPPPIGSEAEDWCSRPNVACLTMTAAPRK